MKILPIFFTILISAYARRKPSCHACIHSVCYNRDTILKGYKVSGQLAMDRTSNVLYFHYQSKRGREFTGAFDLDEVKLSLLPLNFTFGHAVDQDTRNLFTSGVQGVYKYNPIENSTEFYGLKDKTIWHMQFESKLYYTEFKHNGLFSYHNKKTNSVRELSEFQIDNFIIDKNNDIYFMSNYSMFVLKNNTKRANLFEDEIYSMAADRSGRAYFVQPYTRGIYTIDHRTRKFIEVGAFKSDTVFTFVFDSDNNIIYQRGPGLYYLAPTLARCAVATRGNRPLKIVY